MVGGMTRGKLGAAAREYAAPLIRVCVEGNIGSGKSAALALTPALATSKVRVTQEPLADWTPALDLFYKDPKTWSFATTMRCMNWYASMRCLNERDESRHASARCLDERDESRHASARCLDERHERHERDERHERHERHELVERSPRAVRDVFSELVVALTPAQRDLLDSRFSREGWEPDAYVYVHTPVDVCLDRIRSRGRPMERGITRDYLERVEAAYAAMLRVSSVPVIRVDGTRPVRDIARVLVAVLEDI